VVVSPILGEIENFSGFLNSAAGSGAGYSPSFAEEQFSWKLAIFVYWYGVAVCHVIYCFGSITGVRCTRRIEASPWTFDGIVETS